MVTVAIMAVCVVVFLYQLALQVGGGEIAEQAFIYRNGLIPYEVRHRMELVPVGSTLHGVDTELGPVRVARMRVLRSPVEGARSALRHLYLPVILSIFLHGGFFHLAFNMLFLWIFGNNVEDAMGHLRFLLFYLTCGVAAGLIHIVTNLNSQIPTIGASGAIAGVMGAYIILYPRARILTLVPLGFYMSFVEMPAVVFLGMWFLMQLLMAGAGGNVAWFAHIGGFAAGLLLVKRFVKYSPRSHRRRFR